MFAHATVIDAWDMCGIIPGQKLPPVTRFERLQPHQGAQKRRILNLRQHLRCQSCCVWWGVQGTMGPGMDLREVHQQCTEAPKHEL